MLFFPCVSEIQLQRELHVPRSIRRAGDLAARRHIDIRIRRVEVRSVRQVKHFLPELQFRSFCNGEDLEMKKSKFAMQFFRRMSPPELPQVKLAGMVNAALSK
jgi:hypothetical protein